MAKTVVAYNGTTWGSYASANTKASDGTAVFTPAKHADGSAEKP